MCLKRSSLLEGVCIVYSLFHAQHDYQTLNGQVDEFDKRQQAGSVLT